MHQKLRRVKVIRNKPIYRGNRGVYNSIMRVEATAESYLHIGSGLIQPLFDINKVKDSPIDNIKKMIDELEFFDKIPMLRDKIYYIPGSSVKGAVRARAELMFRSVNGEVPGCFIVYDPRAQPGQNHVKIWGDVIYENRFRCDATRHNNVCEICDIFGAPSLLAKVAFSDFIPIGNNYFEIVEIYNEPTLVFKKHTSFVGEILLGDLEDYQIGLLLHAMRIPEGKPILIGRYKYKKVPMDGREEYFGRLKIKVIKSEPETINIDKSIKAFKEKLGLYFRDDLDETNW